MVLTDVEISRYVLGGSVMSIRDHLNNGENLVYVLRERQGFPPVLQMEKD